MAGVFIFLLRRDGRVAEGARLESVYRGNSIGGSNPPLSANFHLRKLAPRRSSEGAKKSESRLIRGIRTHVSPEATLNTGANPSPPKEENPPLSANFHLRKLAPRRSSEGAKKSESRLIRGIRTRALPKATRKGRTRLNISRIVRQSIRVVTGVL